MDKNYVHCVAIYVVEWLVSRFMIYNLLDNFEWSALALDDWRFMTRTALWTMSKLWVVYNMQVFGMGTSSTRTSQIFCSADFIFQLQSVHYSIHAAKRSDPGL
jgi:hypothetical protein